MAMQGQMLVEEHAFHRALILAAALGSTPSARAEYLEQIRANLKVLTAIAEHAPMNYAHKARLVEAEIARLEGNDHAAADLYDLAVAGALDEGYVNHAAIASECAARFYAGRGRMTRAKAYWVEAYHHYALWGATAKLKQLAMKHGAQIGALLASPADGESLLEDITTTTASLGHAGGLDMATVTKASQTIAREIHLDRLLAQLTTIVLENAGAERGFIILHAGDALTIEASGEVGADTVVQSIPVQGCGRLPEALVQYVARTREVLVLDNAATDKVYGADPYIAEQRVKSLLCIPAINHGELVGILYLENNLAEACFTAQRLAVLRILSTQIAISIDHAMLYASLEDKVKERTEELEKVQARLLVLERIETERQLAGGFAHEVRNALAGPTAVLAQALGDSEGEMSVPRRNAGRLADLLALCERSASPSEMVRLKAILHEVFVDEEHVDEVLRVTHQATSRSLLITRQILDYAKTGEDPLAPDVLDVNAMIAKLQRELRKELSDQRIRLEVDLGAGLRGVRARESHLHSVIKNLVQNARDALLGRAPESVEALITVTTRRVDYHACIEVSDNGPGILPEHVQHIFEPFFSTKPNTGTGLGLALVKKIVGLYDGEITVATAVGRGAKFVVTFPEAV
jgi:signal transduction histidine kinase